MRALRLFRRSDSGAAPRRGRAAAPGRLGGLLRRWSPAALGLLLLLGGGVWLLRSGAVAYVGERAGALWMGGVDRISIALGLVVDEVWITGRKEAESTELLAALQVKRGMPILRFDPAAARERVEALGWVREASVRRSFPNEIVVEIVERRPMALWQSHGHMVLIGQDAVTITNHNLGRFGSLLLLVGADAPQYATELFDILAAEPALQRRVVSATRIGNRRWNLKLDNGVEVQLPEDGALGAWMRLAALDREQGVLSRDITVLDLRLPDRLVLKLGREGQREVLPSKEQKPGQKKKAGPGQNT